MFTYMAIRKKLLHIFQKSYCLWHFSIPVTCLWAVIYNSAVWLILDQAYVLNTQLNSEEIYFMQIGLLALGWDKTGMTHGMAWPKAWRDTDKMASVNLHTYLGFWNYELSLWRENSSCGWKLFYRIERKYVMS